MQEVPLPATDQPSAEQAPLYVVWCIGIVVGGIAIASAITWYGNEKKAEARRESYRLEAYKNVHVEEKTRSSSAEPAGTAYPVYIPAP